MKISELIRSCFETQAARRQLRELEENKQFAVKESEKISLALGDVSAQLETLTHRLTEKKPESKWHIAEVIGLWAAAIVGTAAIIVSSRDAGDQREILKTQTELAARAFVSVPSVLVEPTTLSDKAGKEIPAWSFIPVFANDGNAPTKNMVIVAGFKGYSHEPPVMEFMALKPWVARVTGNAPQRKFFARDPAELYGQHPLVRNSILRPHSTSSDMTRLTLNEALLQESQQNGWRNYYYGIIKYRDLYEPDTEHITKFCFMLVGEKDRAGKLRARAPQCDYWNCIDDECLDVAKQYAGDLADDDKKHPNEPRYPTEPTAQIDY